MNNISELLEKYIYSKKYHGLEWIIQHNEKKYSGCLGSYNLKNNKLEQNSLYRIWSMTKPVISIVILQLIDEKKIKLNDTINYFLPIFSNLTVLKKGAKNIEETKNLIQYPTIENLLLHTAGFSYNFLGDIVAEEYHKVGLFYSDQNTLEDEIKTLSKLPLLYEPGSRWVYSVSVDILARIIEVVENNSLQNVLKKKIFEPLKMFNTSFCLNKEQKDKLVTSYHYDNLEKKLVLPDVNPRYISNYGYPVNNKTFARGGIGLYSSAEDYLSFSNMLHTGFSQEGEKIISLETLKKATQNRIPLSYLPFEIKNFDIYELEENVFDSYGWGYGFRVNMQNNKFNNYGEFGWGGAASTYFFVDRNKRISAVLMTQVFQGDINLQKDFYNHIYSQIV